MPVRKPLKRKSSVLAKGAKKPKLTVPISAQTTSGAVLTFGQGDFGQLGLGDNATEKTKPALVPGLNNIVEVAAGGMHTVCLSKDGEVFTFGCNDEGTLGRNTSEEGSEFKPGKVELPEKVIQISAGDSHSAALLQSGRVFAWGSFRDSTGTMGLTLKGVEKVPVEMLPGIAVAKIASGGEHLLMLSASGQLYTCGCGEQGQLGRLPERSANRKARNGLNNLLTPSLVTFKRNFNLLFEDIWAGSFCSFAKEAKSDKIHAFGLNNHNQLGVENKSEKNVYFQPLMSSALCEKGIHKISVGQHHTLILNSEGELYSMGRKEYGRLGLGESCADAEAPVLVPGLKDKKCTDIACGTAVSFAVDDNGSAYAWGMGTNGQLGTGNEEDVHEPKEITGKQLQGRRVFRISSGGQHTVILATNPDVTAS